MQYSSANLVVNQIENKPGKLSEFSYAESQPLGIWEEM